LKGPSFVGFFDKENLIFCHPYKLGGGAVFSLILAQQVREEISYYIKSTVYLYLQTGSLNLLDNNFKCVIPICLKSSLSITCDPSIRKKIIICIFLKQPV